jgi:hypothetical protein
MPGLFNSCRKTPACLDGKLMANNLEAGPRPREPASDLHKLVGDTGIEPVTSSVSTHSPAANALILIQIGKLYESVGLRFTEKDRNEWILAFDLLIEAALRRVARFTAT